MYKSGDIIDWGFDYKYKVFEDNLGFYIETKWGKCRIDSENYWTRSRDKKHLHRLILEDFYNIKLLTDYHGHHLDGNKLNNIIQNLQIVHKIPHGRYHNLGTIGYWKNKKNPKHSKKMKNNKNSAKLNIFKVKIIKYLLKNNKIYQYKIAELFKVHPETIGKINRNENWKNIKCPKYLTEEQYKFLNTNKFIYNK